MRKGRVGRSGRDKDVVAGKIGNQRIEGERNNRRNYM